MELMPAVCVSHVFKRYPVERGWKQVFERNSERWRPALEDVSIAVRAGECFGILGLNGAGKTTLLKLISTLIVPESGSVTVNGYDVRTNARKARTSLGICTSDERAFYGRISAWENLEFFGKLQNIEKKHLRARITELGEQLDLSDRLHTPVRSFSTGMKQRLALVRALLTDPPILLLDEPTKALDPLGAVDFRRMVREQLVRKQRKTVLLATNLLDEAWSTCDRIAVLHERRVAAIGTPVEVEAQAPAQTRRQEQPLFAYMRHISGVS